MAEVCGKRKLLSFLPFKSCTFKFRGLRSTAKEAALLGESPFPPSTRGLFGHLSVDPAVLFCLVLFCGFLVNGSDSPSCCPLNTRDPALRLQQPLNKQVP